MDNEAQLATLLAHEMTHATHRHSLREMHGAFNKSLLLVSTSSLIGNVPLLGQLSSALGRLSMAASINGHSRELETEADMVGIGLVVKAGYDPREALKFFQHLKSAIEEEGEKEPFFFGTHPRLKERIANYNGFLAGINKGKADGITNAEIFRNKTAGVLIDNAFMELRAGRFMQARRNAEKYVTIRPKDGRGYYLLGEIARQSGEDKNLAEGKKELQKGIAADPAYADLYKGLGLIYFNEGNKSEAARAFREYLAKVPSVQDSTYIEEYLLQCK